MTVVTARSRKTSERAKPEHAPTLAELQDRFQEAVMAGDDGLLALIPDNSKTTRDVLLGVYRHAYAARLIEVAGSDYPRLKTFMGAAEFDDMVRGYLAVCPSRHPNVRWFARRLPEYLSSAAPYADRPVLRELAQIERALNDAFDAADAPVLGLGDLARHSLERWGDLSFSPQPSAARLDLATNALAIWRALKDEADAPSALMLPERERLVVWRNDAMPSVRTLLPEEAMMWDEASKGVRFAILCELAATYADPDGAALRAAQYLQGWIAAGMLSKAKLARAKRAKH
jgi:Putative DNA-binding domain